MPFDARENRLLASELVSVEDAERLLEWLLEHPDGQVDLSACTHLHAANLQVLMAAQPHIAAWPLATALSDWLHAAIDKEAIHHVENDPGH